MATRNPAINRVESRDDVSVSSKTKTSRRSHKIAAAMSRRRKHANFSNRVRKSSTVEKANDLPEKSIIPQKGPVIKVNTSTNPSEKDDVIDWPDDNESLFPKSDKIRVESRTPEDAPGMLSWPIEEDLPSFNDLSPTEEVVDGRLKRSLDGASAVMEEERATSISGSSSCLSSDELGRIAKRALKKSNSREVSNMDDRNDVLSTSSGISHSRETETFAEAFETSSINQDSEKHVLFKEKEMEKSSELDSAREQDNSLDVKSLIADAVANPPPPPPPSPRKGNNRSPRKFNNQQACDRSISSNITTKQANGCSRMEVAVENIINEEDETDYSPFEADMNSLFSDENLSHSLSNQLTPINEGDKNGFESSGERPEKQERVDDTIDPVSFEEGFEEGVKEPNMKVSMVKLSPSANQSKKSLGFKNAYLSHLQEKNKENRGSDSVIGENLDVEESNQNVNEILRKGDSNNPSDESTLTRSSGSSSLPTKFFEKGRHGSSSEEMSKLSGGTSSLLYSSYDESLMKEAPAGDESVLLGTLLSSEDEEAKDARKKSEENFGIDTQLKREEQQNDALDFWQKNYAFNQDDDMNKLVEDALTPSSFDDGFKVVPISENKWNIDDKKNSNDTPKSKEGIVMLSPDGSSIKQTTFGDNAEEQLWEDNADSIFAMTKNEDMKNAESASDGGSQFSGSLFSGLEESTMQSKQAYFKYARAQYLNREPMPLPLSPKGVHIDTTLSPPPPPPPPQQQVDKVPYGQVLDGSELLDTVNSDITSSILNGEAPTSTTNADWSKKPQLVITEEKSGDISAESDTKKTLESSSAANNSLLGSVGKASQDEEENSLSSPISSHAPHIREVPVEKDSPSVLTLEAPSEESEEEGIGAMFMSILDTFSNFCAPLNPSKNRESAMETMKNSRERTQNAMDGQSVNTASSSQYTERSAMNENESKKWNEWDKREDSNSPKSNESSTYSSHTEGSLSTEEDTNGTNGDFTSRGETFYTSSAGGGTMGTYSNNGSREENDVYKKQAEAHEKLLSYSKLALTAESGSGTACTTSPSRSETSNEINPANSDSDRHRIMLGPTSKILTSPMDTGFSLNQRRIFEKFCESLYYNGIEVLKQNRDSKWQVRYLTFSKEKTEIRYVKLSHNEKQTGHCPNALLWVKRFSNRSNYSVSLIDKQGRGGVLLTDIVRVSATHTDVLDIPKKHHAKYHKSVVVLVEYNLNKKVRSMTLRCKSKNDAHFFCTGLRVCIDVLKRERDCLMEKRDREGLMEKRERDTLKFAAQ